MSQACQFEDERRENGDVSVKIVLSYNENDSLGVSCAYTGLQ